MAFSFRGPQSPQDSSPFPGYSNNPLSPPRNSNRRSVGGMLGTASTSNSNETRSGLTRRFTTNALPTLSPIGQQRRLAAGDTMQVSAHFERLRGGYEELCKIGIPLLRKEEYIRDTMKIMAGRILWENFLSGTSMEMGCVRKLSFHRAAMVVVCESLWHKRRRLQ